MAEEFKTVPAACSEHGARLLVLEKQVDQLVHTILGNGQPGLSHNVHLANAQANGLNQKVEGLAGDVGDLKISLIELRSWLFKMIFIVGLLGGAAGFGGAMAKDVLLGPSSHKAPAVAEAAR